MPKSGINRIKLTNCLAVIMILTFIIIIMVTMIFISIYGWVVFVPILLIIVTSMTFSVSSVLSIANYMFIKEHKNGGLYDRRWF